MISSTIQAKPAEEQQVERQDHERPPAAHPAAELLDADRADAAGRCREGRRARGAASAAAAALGARGSRLATRPCVDRRAVTSAVGRLASSSSLRPLRPARDRRRDLEEELLEVARRAGEADDRQAGRHRLRRAAAADAGVVAAEPELDRAVGEDRRRRDVRVGREPVAGRLERLALEQDAGRAGRRRSEAARSMSATRPWARTWPRSTIATLVHSSSSSGRMWLLMTMVLPSERSSRSSSRSSTRARGSRPEAGSSSSSTCGSWTSAWARHSRCCMPRDRAWT